MSKRSSDRPTVKLPPPLPKEPNDYQARKARGRPMVTIVMTAETLRDLDMLAHLWSTSRSGAVRRSVQASRAAAVNAGDGYSQTVSDSVTGKVG